MGSEIVVSIRGGFRSEDVKCISVKGAIRFEDINSIVEHLKEKYPEANVRLVESRRDVKKQNKIAHKSWKRFVTGKITMNQIRQIYGLKQINSPIGDLHFVRKNKNVLHRHRIRHLFK